MVSNQFTLGDTVIVSKDKIDLRIFENVLNSYKIETGKKGIILDDNLKVGGKFYMCFVMGRVLSKGLLRGKLLKSSPIILTEKCIYKNACKKKKQI